MAKSVKVHDDTHAVLKELKETRRSRSIDEVVRELVHEATGISVEHSRVKKPGPSLTAFLGE